MRHVMSETLFVASFRDIVTFIDLIVLYAFRLLIAIIAQTGGNALKYAAINQKTDAKNIIAYA